MHLIVMDIYQPTVNFARDKKVVAFVKDRLIHGEPCSVIGMHGMGTEYPFAVLSREVSEMKLPYRIFIFNTVKESDLKEFIKSVEKEQQPVICLIKLRIGKDASWFIDALEDIREKKDFKFVPCVFSYVGDIYTALSEMKKVLTKSLFILQPISYEEGLDMMQELSTRFDFYPTDVQKKEIYNWSYGHVALIKSLFLLKKDYPGKKFDEEFLLSQPSIVSRMIGIIQDIPEEVKETITNKNINPVIQLFSKEFGYIRDGKIFHPLLEKLIPGKSVPMNSIFSSSELKVVEFLKQNVNKLVSREDVAKLIWGEEDWEEKYSEWAIGQLIYRIRKKLLKTSENLDIQTKKGEGFILLQK